MSRKSIVQEKCDIFENDRGKDTGVRIHNVQDKLNNRKSISRNSNRIESILNIQSTRNSGEVLEAKTFNFATNCGTIKDRINKLNLSTSPRPEGNSAFKYERPKSGQVHMCNAFPEASEINQLVKSNNSSIVPELNFKRTNSYLMTSTNSNQTNEMKIGKLDISSFKKFSNENQGSSNVVINKIDKKNAEDSRKSSYPTEQEVVGRKPPLPRKLLKIPPKPTYFNKIKVSPNLSSSSKQQLLAKINLFNELSTSKSAETISYKNEIDQFKEYEGKVGEGSEIKDERYMGYDTIEKFQDVDKLNDNTNDSSSDECSDDNSDDEMVTEYDTIENLNVTKVTVERRYRVSDYKEDKSTFNVTRETYYDHNLNPRIEHISRNIGSNDSDYETVGLQSISKSLRIVQELMQTELSYYKGLMHIYENYITYFRNNSNISKVFGNLEDIYKQQFPFYEDLSKCNNDIKEIAETFLKNEKLFTLYENYSVNNHVSLRYLTGENLQEIKARDKELGQKLDLASYLLTPIQRLTRYLLLLKTLQTTLLKEKNECIKLNQAVVYLEELLENTNTHAKVIQRIQDSPIDFSQRGKYLLSGDFMLKNNRKKYWSTVILLEDIIIFTHKMDEESYVYKDSINFSDIYVRSITEDLTSFQLQNFTRYKQKPDNKYVFDLEVTDPNIKNVWVKKIEYLLWSQFAAHKKRL